LFRCGVAGKASIPFALGVGENFNRHEAPLRSREIVGRKRAFYSMDIVE
jgi:hypothetical protein